MQITLLNKHRLQAQHLTVRSFPTHPPLAFFLLFCCRTRLGLAPDPVSEAMTQVSQQCVLLASSLNNYGGRQEGALCEGTGLGAVQHPGQPDQGTVQSDCRETMGLRKLAQNLVAQKIKLKVDIWLDTRFRLSRISPSLLMLVISYLSIFRLHIW